MVLRIRPFVKSLVIWQTQTGTAKWEPCAAATKRAVYRTGNKCTAKGLTRTGRMSSTTPMMTAITSLLVIANCPIAPVKEALASSIQTAVTATATQKEGKRAKWPR